MHQRALLILAVIAAIAVIAAVWLTQQRRATTVVEAGGPLVAGLSDAVNSVTRVRLEDGRGSVTLERGESGWHIAERGGYPADLTQLRRKLLALGEAQLIEKKTANPDNYALLGVGDPEPVAADGETDADSDERSTRVTLEGLTEPVSVILGKSNFRGNPTTYVRRAGEQQSWLAAGDLTMEADPKEWLKRDLIDIGTPRIKRVVLTHPDGTEIEIEKPARDAPDYALKAVPEGRELLSPSAANSIAGVLGNLRLDNVHSASDFDMDQAGAVGGVFETFDGVRVHTRAWQADDKRYLTLRVEYDQTLVPPPAEEPAAEASAEGESAAAEAADEVAEEVADLPAEILEAADALTPLEPAGEPESEPVDRAAEAETLNANLSGWVFEIPSYKFNNLTKDLEDLLKPLPSGDAE